MSKSRIWDTLRPKRRALQALALTAITAACIALSVAGGSSSTAVLAQQGPPPLRARHGHKILLSGSVPPALHGAKRLGAENTARTLQLTISLGLSDPNGLAALIASQQDPKSPQYHKYISSQAFTTRFAPTPQSVTAVRQFLTSSGLKVSGVSANRTLISASGTVAQVQRAFGVMIDQYQLGKRTVYGPDRAPQIPDTLANIVLDVGGLNDVFQAKPLLVPATAGAAGAAQASRRSALAPQTGPVSGANGPTTLRGAYDVTSLIGAGGNGTNQRVAVYELAPYIASDISAYRAQYGLPSAAINNISVDSATPTCTAGDPSCDYGSGIVEADLDMEVVSALAPNATQDVFVGPNGSGIIDTYNQIVMSNADAVVTTSWGICEPYAGAYDLHALDQIFAQGAAQGQTFLAAAGDSGSDDCASQSGPGNPPSVDSPASDPHVVGVGGTTLTLSGGGYGSETVWNSTCANGACAGGGGISSYFTQPTWQVGGGVVNSYSTGERQVPDVTADANPSTGYSEYCSSTAECAPAGGPWLKIGGTSAAAPLWAGVLTDINAYLAANAKPTLGWANQTIYQLFSNSQTYLPYHDITAGTNDMDYGGSSYAGDYPATACYDQASGVGSPDAWNLARDVQGGVKIAGGGPCPNTAPATTELIQDGGFEQTPSSWTQFTSSISGGPVIYSSSYAHTGAAAFFPCGYASCDDRVSQTITIPASGTVHSAKLRFWVETDSYLPIVGPNPPCVDHIYVTFSSPDGTVVPGGNILPSSCLSNQIFSYQFESLDVTSLLQTHAGQKLTLTFRGTTANEAPFGPFFTIWDIDDASLAYS